MTFDHRLHNMFNPTYYTINLEEDVLMAPANPIFVTREDFQPRPIPRRTFLYGQSESVVHEDPYVNMSQVRTLTDVYSPIRFQTPNASKKEEDESTH